MKKILLIIFLALFSVGTFSQVSTWFPNRTKVNFKDSVNFVKLPFLNTSDTLATRAYSRTVGGSGGVSTSDTAAMLVPYIHRIDTALMLSKYIHRADTATMLTPYINRVDTATMLVPYIHRIDTSTMLSHYITRSDTSGMLTTYITRSDTATMLTPYPLTSEVDADLATKITKGIIDSVNSVGTDARFYSTAGDTLLPYIPYDDRITSNPYFKGQTNTDSLLIHGAYAERTTVNKLKIGGNNSPGTSATPAGDIAIVLDAYMGTDTAMSANHIARIRSQNMMSTHYGSNLIFDTHTSLEDVYGGSTYLLPAMILDYNGTVITPFRNTGTVSNSGGITHAQLARLMYYDEAAATDITKDPQIVCNEAYARDGTIITIMGSSDTNTLKLDDGAGLQLAGGVSFTLGVGDTITLVFNSTLNLWCEISRSDN